MNRLVDGRLVPLTDEDIAQRDRDALDHAAAETQERARAARQANLLVQVRLRYPEVADLLVELGLL